MRAPLTEAEQALMREVSSAVNAIPMDAVPLDKRTKIDQAIEATLEEPTLVLPSTKPLSPSRAVVRARCRRRLPCPVGANVRRVGASRGERACGRSSHATGPC